MKISVVSDIHAGLGRNNPRLRALQAMAVRRSAAYLQDRDIDLLALNGDTTDHLINSLSADTDPEVAREVLAPVATLIRERKGRMRGLVLAGNTDWPVADPVDARRRVFFDYTGLPEDAMEIPDGGLLHTEDSDDVSVVFTHGHAFKPAQWGHDGPMTASDYTALWDRLQTPDEGFLNAISATTGSHRSDYIKAVIIGSAVKLTPRMVREKVSGLLGRKFTADYERHYAAELSLHALRTRKKVLGLMGHTHVAGIRTYEGTTVLNTGTTGAKPNPLQRLSDPRAHLANINTDAGTYELIQTFTAARPDAKPVRVAGGNIADL